MSFRTLIKSATTLIRQATAEIRQARGFGATDEADHCNPSPEAIRCNQQALAQSIALNPRPLRRYEAQTMMLLASHGGRYRQQARAALWLAAQAAGRQNGPTVTREPRLNKASTARLAFWATDRGTPV